MSAARITPSTAMPVNTIMLCGKAVMALVNDVLDMNKLETNQIQEENEPFDLEIGRAHV